MLTLIRIDTSSLDRFNRNLVEWIDDNAIQIVAEVHATRIHLLTGQGVSAFGEVVHDYNREYAHHLGIPVQPKTLNRGSGRLLDLRLEGNVLTVPENMQAIASGQMTGHGGSWGYVHDFLNVSNETIELSEQELDRRTDNFIQSQ